MMAVMKRILLKGLAGRSVNSLNGFRAAVKGEWALRADLVVFAIAAVVACAIPGLSWGERAVMIHSVPSLHTAEAISKQAVKVGEQVRILIEVNIGDEVTKQGVSASEALTLARDIAELPNLTIEGLMAIAPFVENPEDNRENFRRLRSLRDEIKEICEKEGITNAPMTELSMGMTADFEVAIEEGATFVRVGTAIFGERDYSK